MTGDKKVQRALWILIILSVAVRSFLAGYIEFGNDEVYYWTYAKFPDLSHFDHPPMVGWVIQLFTLNLHLHSEFFIRLPSIVFGTINTYLIFLIGRKIKDPLTGLYAALLFTSSFYCFIIAGTFIMPDTPQVLFWLLSMYLLIQCLPDKTLSPHSRKLMLLAGVTIGLALLSKYHSVFLIIGAFLYLLFYNRKWLLAKETWIALGIAVVLFLPVIVWNYHNQFISFTFHEERIDPLHQGIRWHYFLTEIIGQVFYNNPVNFIIIIFAFVALLRGKKFLEKDWLRVILLLSAPLALVFIFFSLFNNTLPHWTGPAYLGFILLAAAFIRESGVNRIKPSLLPWNIANALAIIFIILFPAALQIRTGWIHVPSGIGEDVSKQLFGYKDLGEKFGPIARSDEQKGLMKPSSPILTYRWFPAANFDYYIGSPISKPVYALGTLKRIHKYYWIDKARGDLQRGINAYYIALSDDFEDPESLYRTLFDSIGKPDTINILRSGERIRQAYVYRLFGLKRVVSFESLSAYTEPSAERIHYWEEQIRSHADWMNQVKEKAKRQHFPLDIVIESEARYQAEEEMQR
ncbi:MAG: glycosyltransferase family 39 protein [Bacteroidetes bacterium]|nr:glycosyltransferase family 39 protein [Bacteroidota bacterium]